jgi:hypothetical protein
MSIISMNLVYFLKSTKRNAAALIVIFQHVLSIFQRKIYYTQSYRVF